MNSKHEVDVSVDKELVKDYGENLIGSIDQGTSSTRFLLFTKSGRIAASAQMEHSQIFPPNQVGWHEHDPYEIWSNTVQCMEAVLKAVGAKKVTIKAVGITNQRETTVAWNSKTGLIYYNAIVWDDVRTTRVAAEIAKGNPNLLRPKTGLPVASYFAGTKVKWLLDNVEQLQDDLRDPDERKHVRFGTIDTWLLYQLTGTSKTSNGNSFVDGLFLTDVSNASRWLFLDIDTVQWDTDLIDTVCSPHKVPLSALAEIRPSSQVYGEIKTVPAFKGIPIAGVLGDQQAALFGQTAFDLGEAKNTYGTGLFLMMNTGTTKVPSRHGLLTTIAYQLGNDQVVYALEGSVSHSGSTIQWLRDQLGIIKNAKESETLATAHNDGLYFVPAFAGLFAPHWQSNARACIVGMTASHHKGHICRAALEAAAYQTREVFEAMYADSGVTLKSLRVDGGGTANRLLMQFQADMIRTTVSRPVVMETTARGAAFAAGLAVGVWEDLAELKQLWAVAETFSPKMLSVERDQCWYGWQKAVTKSLGWVDYSTEEEDDEDDSGYVTPEEEEPVPVVDVVPKFPGVGAGMMTLVAAAALTVGIILGRASRK